MQKKVSRIIYMAPWLKWICISAEIDESDQLSDKRSAESAKNNVADSTSTQDGIFSLFYTALIQIIGAIQLIRDTLGGAGGGGLNMQKSVAYYLNGLIYIKLLNLAQH